MADPAIENSSGSFTEPRKPEPSSTTSSRPVEGWPWMEDHLATHDKDWVEGYSQDIDTLLVFAGLFSAILSAFLVQTYQLLQPDSMSTTNQLLAYGCASQRSFIPLPPSLNDTISSLLSPAAFVPPTSARWINSLFFISLIFSLAAALFGIMGKQWLREYIRWNSPLAQPRENVLIRQLRFEAWEDWNVGATISAIPALLEGAMVLFLAGILILGWTLDDIVAIVVAVFTSLFLGGVAAFTVVPIFSKRCPYKSPTAWACIAAWHVLTSPIIRCARSVSQFSPLYQPFILLLYMTICLPSLYIPETRRPQWLANLLEYIVQPSSQSTTACSWRERDLQGGQITSLPSGPWWRRWRWWQKPHDTRQLATQALEDELGHCGSAGELIRGYPSYWNRSSLTEIFLANLSETSALFRALLWVEKSSQDQRVATNTDICLENMPDGYMSLKDWDYRFSVRMLTTWCLVLSLKDRNCKNPELALRSTDHSQPSPVNSLRAEFCSIVKQGADIQLSHDTRGALRFGFDMPAPHAPTSVTQLLSKTIRDLLYCHYAITWDTKVDVHQLQILNARRVLEMIQVLRYVTGKAVSLDTILVPEFFKFLGRRIREPASITSELRWYLYNVATKIEHVNTLSCRNGVISTSRTETGNHESLLLNFFTSESYPHDEWDDHTFEGFVLTAKRWGEQLTANRELVDDPSHHPTMAQVLNRIADVLEAAKDRVGLKKVFNGYSTFSVLLRYMVKLTPPDAKSSLRRILHVYYNSVISGAFGDGIAFSSELHTGLLNAHEDVARCDVLEGCPWISHRCEVGVPNYDDHCPLLYPNPPLPPGWELRYAPGPSKQAYYVDHNTCTTTWKRPPRLINTSPQIATRPSSGNANPSPVEALVRDSDESNPDARGNANAASVESDEGLAPPLNDQTAGSVAPIWAAACSLSGSPPPSVADHSAQPTTACDSHTSTPSSSDPMQGASLLEPRANCEHKSDDRVRPAPQSGEEDADRPIIRAESPGARPASSLFTNAGGDRNSGPASETDGLELSDLRRSGDGSSGGERGHGDASGDREADDRGDEHWHRMQADPRRDKADTQGNGGQGERRH